MHRIDLPSAQHGGQADQQHQSRQAQDQQTTPHGNHA
ncbi:hypothetical protein L485_14890 [Sphingobium baderi LL03]|uniref:Uncharacterized protein n=1 Tax=Sphingobium baderi LL03 TaxID=1114964 RepID=T0HPZ9_9SPHN|nr:hypothetical protein L485_14890 [Sphingobium baderi LL03]